MDSEPVISAMRPVPQVILLTTKGRGIAPHVGLQKKTPRTRVLMKLEPQTGRLRQSGSAKNTVVTKDLYQLGQCLQEKIEVGP